MLSLYVNTIATLTSEYAQQQQKNTNERYALGLFLNPSKPQSKLIQQRVFVLEKGVTIRRKLFLLLKLLR